MNFSRFLIESAKDDIQTLSNKALDHLNDAGGEDFQLAVNVLADFLEFNCKNQFKADALREYLRIYNEATSQYSKSETLNPIYLALRRGQFDGFIAYQGPACDEGYITAIRIEGAAPDSNSSSGFTGYVAFAKVKDSVLNECYSLQVPVADFSNDYGNMIDRERNQLIIEPRGTSDRAYNVRSDGLQYWPTFKHYTNKSSYNLLRKTKSGYTPTNNERYGNNFIDHIQSMFEVRSYIQIVNDLGRH